MSRAIRIALSGYYGFDNAGDEAVLAGLIRAFQLTPGGLNVELTALSINPESTQAEHQINAAHRYQVRPLLATLASTDMLLSGGGSLLQDVTSAHGIFYYLGVVRAAQILGKKTMFVAQGIGPLTLSRSRKLTASVARRCDAITVRDPESATLLRGIDVATPEIIVTADPALLLGEASSSAGTGAAISLREWKDAPPNFAAQVAEAAATVLGAPIVTSMLMSPSDSGIHDQFLNSFNARLSSANAPKNSTERMSWKMLTLIAAQSSMVIGMRLHSLILAAANGVPSVALSYDPKVDAFMQLTGQGDAVYNIRDKDPSKIEALLSKVWQERVERASLLRTRLPDLRAAAIKNAEVALRIL